MSFPWLQNETSLLHAIANGIPHKGYSKYAYIHRWPSPANIRISRKYCRKELEHDVFKKGHYIAKDNKKTAPGPVRLYPLANPIQLILKFFIASLIQSSFVGLTAEEPAPWYLGVSAKSPISAAFTPFFRGSLLGFSLFLLLPKTLYQNPRL